MKRFIRPFKTTTVKDISILFFGNVSSVVLGFVLTWILTKSLNPAIFGIFATARVFIQLMFKLLEFGFRPAILNFYSGERRTKDVYLKIIFLLLILFTLIAGIIIFVLSPWIALTIFRSQEILPYLQISVIGIIFFVLISCGLGFFQARKRFFESAIVTILMNLSRVTLVIATLLVFTKFTSHLYLFLALQIGLVVPIIFIITRIDWSFFKSKMKIGYFKEVLNYVFPIGLGFAFVALYTRIDQLLVFNLLGETEAGFYGLAYQLGTSVIFFTYAFSYAMIPRFVSLNNNEFKAYLSKTVLLSIFLAAILLLIIPASPPLFLLLFGEKYSHSVLPFQIFLFSAVFFLLSLPFSNAILYRFKRVWSQTVIYFLSLVVVLIAILILTPKFGVAGAASAVLLMYIFQFLLTLVYFSFLSKNILSLKDVLKVSSRR